MGGKTQGQSGPVIRPRGPTVSNVSAGPPILNKIIGPQVMQNAEAFDKQRDTTSKIVGAVAGVIMNAFYPGTGGVASAASESIVRQQYNTLGDRPFFESSEEPWKDWPSLLIGTVAGYGGGLLGEAASAGAGAGGAADVATQAGYTSVDAATGVADVAGGVGALAPAGGAGGSALGAVGSWIGRQGGNYAGKQIKRQIYGGGQSRYRRYRPAQPLYSWQQ